MALNGLPPLQVTEAISLFVSCEDQAEIDRLWARLGEGGQDQQCRWLKDRYGLSWQIVPAALGDMMQDPDPARAGRVMQAMLKMVKLDLAQLQAAYNSPP